MVKRGQGHSTQQGTEVGGARVGRLHYGGAGRLQERVDCAPYGALTRSWARENFIGKPELEERVTRKAWRGAPTLRQKAPVHQPRIPEDRQHLESGFAF